MNEKTPLEIKAILSFVLSHMFLEDGENLFYVLNQTHLAKKGEEVVTKKDATSFTNCSFSFKSYKGNLSNVDP